MVFLHCKGPLQGVAECRGCDWSTSSRDYMTNYWKAGIPHECDRSPIRITGSIVHALSGDVQEELFTWARSNGIETHVDDIVSVTIDGESLLVEEFVPPDPATEGHRGRRPYSNTHVMEATQRLPRRLYDLLVEQGAVTT